MLEFLTDPAIWIGLATLVLLEIVLGIDNLIFIAILADKLPPQQRDKARIVGLSLALIMRLALLSVISWLVTLTTPWFSVFGHPFSGRDIILLLGGLFLLFKATTELHERLEGAPHTGPASAAYASFTVVVTQIVVLDAVFSLDSVITAVGMVNNLPVMMAAVIIAIAVMLVASKPLTRFVSAHPTVVVLCLSFLLMIGLSLVAEGLGFHLPKGYLYAAIGFSVMIEALNQVARRNRLKYEAKLPLRERTAQAVIRLLGAGAPGAAESHTGPASAASADEQQAAFGPEERNMVSGVLTLAERNARSIMTPRSEISWVDLNDEPRNNLAKLLGSPHSLFPVCRGSLDEVVGVARAKDLLADLTTHGAIDENRLRAPIYMPETLSVIRMIDVLRQARGQVVLVNDEYGVLQGLVSPIDVLEAIAGDFPDEDETPSIREAGPNAWHAIGGADLHHLQRVLGIDGLVDPEEDHVSLAGFLLSRFDHMPQTGDTWVQGDYEFKVTKASAQRIEEVAVKKVPPPETP